MHYNLKRIRSAALALALVGSAALLSVTAAKDPYGDDNEHAVGVRPVGHLDKALIGSDSARPCECGTVAGQDGAFDWGIGRCEVSEKRAFSDSQVTPVVLDLPELLGPNDAAAVQLIKRKLGIDPFRGSIFEDSPAAPGKLLHHESSAESNSFDGVLQRLFAVGGAQVAGMTQCQSSLGAACELSGCADGCAAACESQNAVAHHHDQGACSPPAPGDHAAFFSTRFTGGQMAPTATMPERAHLLRSFGPQLDNIAQHLEEAELFDEADAIRETAQALRVKARGLKTGSTAGAVAPRYVKPVSVSFASDCACCKDKCGSKCGCSDAAPAYSESQK